MFFDVVENFDFNIFYIIKNIAYALVEIIMVDIMLFIYLIKIVDDNDNIYPLYQRSLAFVAIILKQYFYKWSYGSIFNDSYGVNITEIE